MEDPAVKRLPIKGAGAGFLAGGAAGWALSSAAPRDQRLQRAAAGAVIGAVLCAGALGKVKPALIKMAQPLRNLGFLPQLSQDLPGPLYHLSTEGKLLRVAQAQIALATAGRRLQSYNQEVHPGGMLQGPGDDKAAHVRAAYWLATAARLTGSKSLVAYAQKHASLASAQSAIPFVGEGSEKIQAILREAFQLIQGGASGAPAQDIRAILEILSQIGKIESVQIAQQRQQETGAGRVDPKDILQPGGPDRRLGKKQLIVLGAFGLLLIGALVIATSPARRAARASLKRASSGISEARRGFDAGIKAITG